MNGPLDEIARFNQERWSDLVANQVAYSRPFRELTVEEARHFLDEEGILGDVSGRDVLCLAGGGGQQSVAFAKLGAHVTVFDLTEGQLEKDREMAAHHGFSVRTVQGDMRELSVFADNSFDLVYHAWSMTFIPDARPVLREVTRILRRGGLYRTHWANPFYAGVEEWTDQGYLLRRPYVDGAELVFDDDHWDVEQPDGSNRKVVGPREFRHALSTVVNTLASQGFILLGVWENPPGDLQEPPGSWEHLCAFAPPWLTLWAQYEPDLVHTARRRSPLRAAAAE